LYDLPGERIADAAMVGRDFAAWSDHVLAVIQNDSSYRTCCAPFLEAARPGVPEADLVGAYKLSLANLILNFKPLVTPSTFLLDTKGQLARPDSPENLAAARVAGVDGGSEFCPLPPALR